MKTREQKIEAIYEKIANKKIVTVECCPYCNGGVEYYDDGFHCSDQCDEAEYECNLDPRDFGEKEIEDGYEKVMIGDVLYCIEENIINKNSAIDFSLKLILLDFRKKDYLWKYKRKPIEEQSDEAINYVYNLIQDN